MDSMIKLVLVLFMFYMAVHLVVFFGRWYG